MKSFSVCRPQPTPLLCWVEVYLLLLHWAMLAHITHCHPNNTWYKAEYARQFVAVILPAVLGDRIEQGSPAFLWLWAPFEFSQRTLGPIKMADTGGRANCEMADAGAVAHYCQRSRLYTTLTAFHTKTLFNRTSSNLHSQS